MERAPLRNAGCVVTSSTRSAPIYTTRPSRSDSRCSLPLFSIIVNLVKDAAAARGERAVVHTRRSAGVSRREALLSALALLVVADHEVALHDIDLFPVIVHEGLGGERAGLDLEQPRAAALLRFLVEVGGEDLLVEAGWIARRHFPAVIQVDAYELEVLLGSHAASFASCRSTSLSATARSPLATSLAASARSSRKRLASSDSKSTSLMRCW